MVSEDSGKLDSGNAQRQIILQLANALQGIISQDLLPAADRTRRVLAYELLVANGAVRMDVGYIFGNATGSQAAVRAYWSNHGPTASITNDVPSESRLEPNLWGRVSVE